MRVVDTTGTINGVLFSTRDRHDLFERRASALTTWLIPETLDWRIVTASPIEGFLELAMAEARKARDCREVSCWYWLTLLKTLENILL